jgi:hypothetical protein
MRTRAARAPTSSPSSRDCSATGFPPRRVFLSLAWCAPISCWLSFPIVSMLVVASRSPSPTSDLLSGSFSLGSIHPLCLPAGLFFVCVCSCVRVVFWLNELFPDLSSAVKEVVCVEALLVDFLVVDSPVLLFTRSVSAYEVIVRRCTLIFDPGWCKSILVTYW